MLRSESNNFALALYCYCNSRVKKKDLSHFATSHHLVTMKYAVSNKTLSLKRLSHWNAMDGVSLFTAIGKLHATPSSGKKKCNFFLMTTIESVTHRNIFSPSRKAFSLRFCTVYITVTSSSMSSKASVTEAQSVVACYGRSSSGFVNGTLLPHSGNVQDLRSKFDFQWKWIIAETCRKPRLQEYWVTEHQLLSIRQRL